MRSIPANARNRRVSNTRQRKQQHVLDVKLRESKERSRRTRAIAGFVCKLVLFAAIAGGSWLGGKEALRRFVWENPDYAIREVKFSTDGALTREQVLTVSGIVEGKNIFTIPLGKARQAIEAMPQVDTAEVQRLLPNRVSITISERKPIAWIAAKGEEDPTSSEKSFLIDVRGYVMRTRTLLPEYYHLPVLTGVETENLAPGQKVTAFEMQAALELLRLNAESTRFQIRTIDLGKGYGLVATDQRRAKITFGFDRLDVQLERLNRVLDYVEPAHKELQTVNLLVERNLPVTFYEPDAEAAPGAANTLHPMIPAAGANSAGVEPGKSVPPGAGLVVTGEASDKQKAAMNRAEKSATSAKTAIVKSASGGTAKAKSAGHHQSPSLSKTTRLPSGKPAPTSERAGWLIDRLRKPFRADG